MDSRREKYKDKILSHIIGKTKLISTEDESKILIEPPFVAVQVPYLISYLSSHPTMTPFPRWAFIGGFNKYCELFGLSKSELTDLFQSYNDALRDVIKNKYYDKGSINESIEDKQKKYLEYVYNDLIKNTKFRNASSLGIDLYDGKCKSLQIGIRWGSEAPYFNYVPDCLENYLKDYWGLTYNEIQELFWDKYEQHIINMVLSKKENVSPHVRVHVDYLRESKMDKQTEFLKKVVDIMIKETVPYNETKGSVITPFFADKNNNGRWIMSAHYCKRVVDDFDYEFTDVPFIINNYLEMFGLSYEEMRTVMYGYFKGIFEKYFKRFFDLSYKTRPRLDEGIDLGFVNKVADSVLREIVWDFDRGLVHFPMINYSSGIRDDSFLMGLDNDNPSMEGSGSYMGVPIDSWNTDLMKHIEDTYAISGSEYNIVWGSLQGEIWEKTNEYWDSFTSGY